MPLSIHSRSAPFYRFFKAERILIFAKKIEFCWLTIKTFVSKEKHVDLENKKKEISAFLIKEFEMFSNDNNPVCVFALKSNVQPTEKWPQ